MNRQPRKRPASGRTHESRPRAALVVGLGASAGGLEPLQTFFQHVRAKSGLVFVVVQHLKRAAPACSRSCWAGTRPCRCSRPPTECAQSLTTSTSSPGHPPRRRQGGLVAVTEAAPISPIDASSTRSPRTKATTPSASSFRAPATTAPSVSAGSGSSAGSPWRSLLSRQPPACPKRRRRRAGRLRCPGRADVRQAHRARGASYKLACAHAAGTRRAARPHLGAICSLTPQRTGHDFSHYKEEHVAPPSAPVSGLALGLGQELALPGEGRLRRRKVCSRISSSA